MTELDVTERLKQLQKLFLDAIGLESESSRLIAPMPPSPEELAEATRVVKPMPPSPEQLAEKTRVVKPMPPPPREVEAQRKPVRAESKEEGKQTDALQASRSFLFPFMAGYHEAWKQYQRATEAAQEQLAQNYAKIDKVIEDFSRALSETQKKQEEISRRIQEELKKPAPKPPTLEEVTLPKDSILAFFRQLAPTVIGMLAMLRPGRYGENLAFYVAMNKAIKEADLQKYSLALQQWKLSFEVAKQEKLNVLKALEVEAKTTEQNAAHLGKIADLALKRLNLEQQRIRDQIRAADSVFQKITKELEMTLRVMKAEQELMAARERLAKEERREERAEAREQRLREEHEWKREKRELERPKLEAQAEILKRVKESLGAGKLTPEQAMEQLEKLFEGRYSELFD